MKLITISLFLAFIILSCKKDNLSPRGDLDELVGSWGHSNYYENYIIYERTDGLKENEYGFTCNPDGTFIERKNAGWCGTPPLTYEDYEGTWTINDSIIEISVGYWGGTTYYTWKLISVNHETLTITSLEEVYHRDN